MRLLEELFSSYSLRVFYLIICKLTSVHKLFTRNLYTDVILQILSEERPLNLGSVSSPLCVWNLENSM